jgi:hypothetical protein
MTNVLSNGKVVERFLALQHFTDTTSEALNVALFALHDKNKLCISRIRGQAYDGNLNMRGEFNGLQKKILEENPYAIYVHCFAHQLQLVVVSVASCCSLIRVFLLCLLNCDHNKHILQDKRCTNRKPPQKYFR